jgi:hypothetical protein
MKIEAFLCDGANVREGLLNILSAGITRVHRQTFPAPLGVQLAIMATLMQVEARAPHALRLVVQGEDGETAIQLDGQFGFGEMPKGLQPGEPIAVPMVIDLRNARIPKAGIYSLEIVVDNQHMKSLPFVVSDKPIVLMSPAPPPPGQG